jgi:hypothetical protein
VHVIRVSFEYNRVIRPNQRRCKHRQQSRVHTACVPHLPSSYPKNAKQFVIGI